MEKLFLLVILSVAIFATGCGQTVTEQTSPLEDGIYGVVQIEQAQSALPVPGADQFVIEYRQRFVEDGDKEAPKWFLLELSSLVPLELTQAPVEKSDALELSLSQATATGLKSLSTKFVGKTVAIIVGGEVATAHLVREPVEMSHLQISC